jgi:SPP1 family predicted phage head-tail adaptor
MGGPVVVWSPVATVWAAIWPVSASEVVKANATTMIVSHRVRIRFRSVMKAAWRIKFGNRYFSIGSIINPNEANEYLDLLCKEAA